MILIDTCVLLFIADGKTLPPGLVRAMERESWAVSALSAWEIGIKAAGGKLRLDNTPALWWPRVVAALGIQVIPFSDAMAILASTLPAFHHDPFDRGIIATALHERMSLATVDGIFDQYRKPCDLNLAGIECRL